MAPCSFTSPSLVNILIIDDHPLIRDGMAGMLRSIKRDVGLTQATECRDALAAIEKQRPDLVLLDLGLPDVAGTAAIDLISSACSGVPIVVLSGQDDRETVIEALRHGVAGFIPKNLTQEQIWSALSVVLAGDVYLPACVAGIAVTNSIKPSANREQTGAATVLERLALTNRQREILRTLLQGLTNKEIAAALDLAEATVKAHVSAVLRAMNVGSRSQVILWATRHGIQIDDL